MYEDLWADADRTEYADEDTHITPEAKVSVRVKPKSVAKVRASIKKSKPSEE